MPSQSETYTDKPWIYVYDGDALTNGQNYQNLFVNILSDSDFILRRIAGFRNLLSSSSNPAATILLKRYGVAIESSPVSGGLLYDWPVLPELIFEASSIIGFDLTNITKRVPSAGNVGTPNYGSQFIFQGVRRFYAAPPATPKFNPRNFSYSANLTITTAGKISPAYTVNSPKFTLIVPMTELSDFELRAVLISVIPGSTGYPPTTYFNDFFKTMLFDYQQQPVFSAPILGSFLNYDSSYVSCFPVPTMVYPSKSQIQVDVYSLLSNLGTLPLPLSFTFIGVLRDPA